MSAAIRGFFPRYLRAESFALAPSESSTAGVRILATGPVSVHTCRAMREFGASRFAIVTPSLPRGGAARGGGGVSSDAAARLLQSAIVSGFTAGGRRWEWLHGKYRSPAALFFSPDAPSAAEGGGVSAATVRAWHVPPHAPLSVHKYAARMDLAFSKSVPAGRVAVAGERRGGAAGARWELRAVPDVFAERTGVLMTDGCAGAGADVMLAAAAAMAADGVDARGGGGVSGGPPPSPPAAFQGRLGGYKGVWYLDPSLPRDVICVRPSQRKLDINLCAAAAPDINLCAAAAPDINLCAAAAPDINLCAAAAPTTRSQRDVEVLRVSRDRGASALNPQISLLLAGWGVSAAALCALVRGAAATARDALSNEAAARALLSASGAAAGDDATEARALLDAGFWGEPRLTSLLVRVAAKMRSALGARGRVAVPQSRTVLVIADPTGSLAEDEAFFWPSALSAPLTTPLLLARNPCHAADDVSVKTGVSLAARIAGDGAAQWETALRDVLVLSVKGDAPAAGALAGGDYDGDVVWVCWDGALVAPVAQNKAWVRAHGPPVPSTAASARAPAAPLRVGAAPVPAVAPPPPTPPSVHALADVYLSSLTDATLGHATNLHLAWVDKALSDDAAGGGGSARRTEGPPRALWSRHALALVNLCRILVDASKTGDAPPIPDWLKTVAYPHWTRTGGASSGGLGAGGGGSTRSTFKSLSPLGAMHDEVSRITEEETAVRVAAVRARSGGGGVAAAVPPPSDGIADASHQNLESLERFVGLSPPSETPELRPHPRIVALSERFGARAWTALAEAHLNAFISDCTSGRNGAGATQSSNSDFSGSESEGSSGGSGDDGDTVAEGCSAASSSFIDARARARRRLAFADGPNGAEGGERTEAQRTALALAYYRVAWARFESGSSRRSEPHAFPWIAAGPEIVAAAMRAR
jgi:hypothetical protein